MFPGTDDLLRALPELIWCGFGMLAMLLQPFVRSRHFFTVLALVGAVGGTAAAFVAGATPGEGFYGLIQSDVFSFFFRLLIGLVAILVVLAANLIWNARICRLRNFMRCCCLRRRAWECWPRRANC